MAENTNVQKKVSRIKEKKKSWFAIVAPKVFGMKEIGESYLSTPQEAVGRMMKINLKELTGNVKDQNVNIAFKVTHIQNNKLMTAAVGYHLAPAYVRRAVRKNIDRKDDYAVLKTRDNKTIVVKTLMITLNQTKRSIRAKISALMKEGLKEEFLQMSFNQLINSLVLQKIQYPLKKKLSKIYPLRELAIRSLFLKDSSQAGEDTETFTQKTIKTEPVESGVQSVARESSAETLNEARNIAEENEAVKDSSDESKAETN